LALLLHVVYGDDSGVGQDARQARLPEQALAQPVLFLGLAPCAEMDGLDGHRAADVGVDGMVRHPHGAPPQFPDDLISPDAIHPVLVIAHGAKFGDGDTVRSVVSRIAAWFASAAAHPPVGQKTRPSAASVRTPRSEEHTSELQSLTN